MTYQFPTAPAQGEIAQLPSGHKYQFNNGRWRVYSGNLPTNVQPVVIQLPPIYATTPPPIQDNPFWLDTVNDVLHVKTPDGAGGFTWEIIGGGSVDLASIRAEFAAADAVVLQSANQHSDGLDATLRQDTNTAIANTLSTANGYTDTREAAIRADMSSAPIESETPPTLPNSNPFWYKPSTSVMHYQYNDGNSTQWIEI